MSTQDAWSQFLGLSPTEQVRQARVVMLNVVDQVGDDYAYSDTPGHDGRAVCVYVHVVEGEEVPGCLVAHVLHALGMPLSLMGSEVAAYSFETWGISWQLGTVLSAAQGAQDAKTGTWSAARRAATATEGALFRAGQLH